MLSRRGSVCAQVLLVCSSELGRPSGPPPLAPLRWEAADAGRLPVPWGRSLADEDGRRGSGSEGRSLADEDGRRCSSSEGWSLAADDGRGGSGSEGRSLADEDGRRCNDSCRASRRPPPTPSSAADPAVGGGNSEAPRLVLPCCKNAAVEANGLGRAVPAGSSGGSGAGGGGVPPGSIVAAALEGPL